MVIHARAAGLSLSEMSVLYFIVNSNIVVRLLKSFMILSVPNGSLHCQHSSLLCKNMQNLTSFVELAKQYIL